MLVFSLSLQEAHLARIKHLWASDSEMHIFLGRQILLVRSGDIATAGEGSPLNNLKKLMDDQQAGKATLDRLLERIVENR